MWKRNRSSNLPPPAAARGDIGTPTLVESTLDEATAATLHDLPAGGTTARAAGGGTDHARPREVVPSAVTPKGKGRGPTDAHGYGETPPVQSPCLFRGSRARTGGERYPCGYDKPVNMQP